MPHQLLLEVEYPAIAPLCPTQLDSATYSRLDMNSAFFTACPFSSNCAGSHRPPIAQLTEYARANMPATIEDNPRHTREALSSSSYSPPNNVSSALKAVNIFDGSKNYSLVIDRTAIPILYHKSTRFITSSPPWPTHSKCACASPTSSNTSMPPSPARKRPRNMP